MKTTYKQVKDDHTQLRGEIYAFECKIESKVDGIAKELEQCRKATTNPRAFEKFPDLSVIGVTTPPKKGTWETYVHTSTGNIKTTMNHYLAHHL